MDGQQTSLPSFLSGQYTSHKKLMRWKLRAKAYSKKLFIMLRYILAKWKDVLQASHTAGGIDNREWPTMLDVRSWFARPPPPTAPRRKRHNYSYHLTRTVQLKPKYDDEKNKSLPTSQRMSQTPSWEPSQWLTLLSELPQAAHNRDQSGRNSMC